MGEMGANDLVIGDLVATTAVRVPPRTPGASGGRPPVVAGPDARAKGPARAGAHTPGVPKDARAAQ